MFDITCKDNDPELLYNQEYKNEAFIRYGSMVCKGGVVVRAFVPHQCRPSRLPRLVWVELALVLSLTRRGETAEERGRQTLCDKRDNNFDWKNIPPDLTVL